MELQQLKYFITVAKMEHFSKAAEELNISQSALSLAIQRLASELGVPLFEKDGRNVKLTAYGKVFLAKVEPLYEQLIAAAASLSRQKNKENDRVVVYGPSMFSFRNLMQKIHLCAPEIGLKNVAIPQEEALERIRNGRGDIAILMLPPDYRLNEDVFEYELFPRYDLVAIMNDKHRLAKCQTVTSQQLSGEPISTYSEGINVRPVLEDYFAREGCFLDVEYESDIIFDQIGVVRTGQAVGVMRSRLVSMHNMTNIVCKSIYPNVLYNVCVVWKKGRSMRKSFKRIQDVILPYFANDEE